jgi:hypothetical protein
MTKFEFLIFFSDFRVQPIKRLVLNSNKNIDQSAATTSVRVTPQQRLVPIIRSSMDDINQSRYRSRPHTTTSAASTVMTALELA